jgi:hypothetical protein
LPAAEHRSIAEQIEEATYWWSAHEAQWGRGAGLYAVCPGQKMAVHADARGVKVNTGDAEVTLELAGAADTTPRAENERLIYDRGGGTEEWYINTPSGLEQGWTVREGAPACDPSDQADILFTVRVRTALTAHQPARNGCISFHDATGAACLHYDKLLAWDAAGRALPAMMSLAEDRASILVAVNDAGARYPVTIDPLIFTSGGVFGGDAANDSLGRALAVSGTTLVSGTANGEHVLIFENQSGAWVRTKRLNRPSGAGKFGLSVALDGDRLVVGSPSSSVSAQNAFIFERNQGGSNNWGLVKTLAPAVAPVTNGQFGFAVGVSGDIVAVGGQGETGMVANTGAVTIFARDTGGVNNWGLERRIIAPDGAGQDSFGLTLVLEGGRLVAGAEGSDSAGVSSGAAYIFERNQGGALQWGLVKKLQAPAPGALAFFGHALSLDGDGLLAGESRSDLNGESNGRAHLFRRNLGGANQWGLEQSFQVTDATSSEGAFGSSVALRGTDCLIGAAEFDNDGAAFFFRQSNGVWRLEETILPPAPGMTGRFGDTVALGSDAAVAGARDEDFAGREAAGRVHVFAPVETGSGDWNFHASPAVAAPGAVTLADLGFSVALDGSTLVIGAPNSDDTANTGSGEGAAYVFERNQGGADAWQLRRRLLAGSAGVNSGFGSSVSVAGDFIAVGAPTDNTGRGEVYVYSRNTGGTDVWGELKRLNSPTNTPGEEFGYSVSLTKDAAWLAVGAPGAGGGGKAHVYFINTGGVNNWGLIRTLDHPPVPAFASAGGDRFGHAVSLSWPRLLIGAPGAEGVNRGTTVLNAGRAYLFEINTGGVNTWGLEAELFPGTVLAEGVAGAEAGTSVSLDGSLAAVGAPGEATDSGSITLYERNDSGANAWGTLRKITDPAGAAGDRFGSSVSLRGPRLAVGTPGSDFISDDSGGVCIFRQNLGGADQWKLESRLSQPNCLPGAALGASVALSGSDLAAGAPNLGTAGSAAVWRKEFTGLVPVRTVAQSTARQFGRAIALHDGFLAVGAPLDSVPAVNQGSAYIFRRNGGGADNWGLVKKITAGDGAANDSFGISVALSDAFLVVGAIFDDDRGSDSGSAYVFDRNQGGADQWGQVRKITAGDGSVDNLFGGSLALHEEVLVISSRGSSAAYIHERNQGGLNLWGLSRKVASPATRSVNVAVHGHTVAVGDGNGGFGGGGVSLFSRNSGGAGNWGLLKTIAEPAGAANFGGAVGLSSDILVVGASQDETEAANAGAAFVYQRNSGGTNNWGLVRRLAPGGPAADSRFGEQVAIESARIVVSRRNDTEPTVHVFEQNTGGRDAWGETARIMHPALTTSGVGEFSALALADGLLAVGNFAEGSGRKVVVFDLNRSAYETCLRTAFGDAAVNDPAKEVTHWGDAADFDGDGLSTIEEVFFGRDPVRSDAAGVTHQPVVVSSAILALQWTQPGEAFGIRACPQWSTDLSNWFVSGEDPPGAAPARTITTSRVGTLNGLDIRMAQVPRSGSPRLWLRLKLSRE